MAKYQITGTVDIGYFLSMNPMTGRIEERQEFGPYDSAEEALAFHDSQLAPERWVDQQMKFVDGTGIGSHQVPVNWNKAFKKGSPLEWMNPLTEAQREKPDYHHRGVLYRMQNLEIATKVKVP